VPDYTLSPQGIETIFATNHVGHYTLTNLLLPLIESTASKYGDARIVNTTSSFHMGCQELDLSLVTSPTPVKWPANIDSCWRYARSKLAVILFTRQLAKILQKKGANNVYANCFFPGNIPTEAMDTWKQLFGPVGYLMKGTFWVLGQSSTDAAATAIFLASSHDVVKRELKGKWSSRETCGTGRIAKSRRLWARAGWRAAQARLWERGLEHAFSVSGRSTRGSGSCHLVSISSTVSGRPRYKYQMYSPHN